MSNYSPENDALLIYYFLATEGTHNSGKPAQDRFVSLKKRETRLRLQYQLSLSFCLILRLETRISYWNIFKKLLIRSHTDRDVVEQQYRIVRK